MFPPPCWYNQGGYSTHGIAVNILNRHYTRRKPEPRGADSARLYLCHGGKLGPVSEIFNGGGRKH